MKETKEKIILKALQYLAKNDYQSVSLNSIAEGIGITKGGIYHYFNSKDELLMECIITVFKRIHEYSLEAMNADGGLEEVLGSMFSFDDIFRTIAESLNIDFLDNYFDYISLIFIGIKKFPRVRKMVTDVYSQIQQGLDLMFTELQAKGFIKAEINCKLLSFELMAMIEGSMLISELTKGIDLSEVGKDLVKSTLERICV